jgi:hypothetical protein
MDHPFAVSLQPGQAREAAPRIERIRGRFDNVNINQ